jgi:hypothetical protein
VQKGVQTSCSQPTPPLSYDAQIFKDVHERQRLGSVLARNQRERSSCHNRTGTTLGLDETVAFALLRLLPADGIRIPAFWGAGGS